VRDLPSQARRDIRAELALQSVSSVPRFGPATKPEIASTALAARAIARIDQMVARTAGQSLFAGPAPGATPASGWQSAMAEPRIGFRAEPQVGFDIESHTRPEIRRHPSSRSSGPRRRTIDGGAPAGNELSDKSTGRAPLAGWSSPIAAAQAGFVEVLPQAIAGEQTQVLRDVVPTLRRSIPAPPTTVPASRNLRGPSTMIGTERNGSLMAASAEATLSSDIDLTTSASFSPLRAGNKLLFTGPAAAKAAPALSTHPSIDPIDFAEQMRIALIEDARRHGIEV
jgi:hypothetical protein